ncbi:hypothetical protein BH708_18890 [Brachybacterium sp. P6-10-X1]|uniref:DUF4439 domain-containing protein n=1 Tax=Brachybacterium sp. P6-10-X1 TaxID=1903186 RepID=UPI0009719515|nr:DUF4439 domain-containing protein [Brachybacterium sp. P6-10-X1]APX34430.1 hypothetical protein BH708_18890 [Brachybacterium sp. P6-10-X1]
MHRPVRPSFPARPVSRRRLLSVGTIGVLALPAALSGCGPIRLGGPEQYTPPPPGIDDLYRSDLLTLIERAEAGRNLLAQRADAGSGASSALDAALGDLGSALPVQRTALLTGAQYEREQDAASDPAVASTPPPPEAPEDAAALVAVLVDLRRTAADAARQVSGSLARPVVAIAARTAWSVHVLQQAAEAGEVPALRTSEEIRPRREVPETDPPSIGAEVDYHSTLEQAQQEEWYTGYVHEVLAARTSGDVREGHLVLRDRHRQRAETLTAVAEEDGGPVVPRQAVYALPDGALEEGSAARLPAQLARALMVDHVALVGAAPFARRPLSIVAAMQEAETLVGRAGQMRPLPSLEAEDPPPGDAT